MYCCKVCKERKPEADFPKNQKVRGGKVYTRKTCHVCWGAERSVYTKNKRQTMGDEIRAKDREKHFLNPERKHTATQRHYRKLKAIVYDHYGYMCDCCGETEHKFLTIDHINNDGADHRRNLGVGHIFYKWIITNDFPNSVRVLCFNCNNGRYHNGGVCPHEERHADIVPIGWKAEVK